MSRAAFIIVAAVAFAGSACDEATEPRFESEIGSYMLTEVNGHPVPAPVLVLEPDSLMIAAGYFHLRSDSSFGWQIRQYHTGPPPSDTLVITRTGWYERLGDRVVVHYPWEGGDVIEAPDTLEYDDGKLMYRLGGYNPTDLLFEQQAE